MAAAMRQALAEEPDTLFVVAAYHIGKEKVFLGAAKALGCKVCVRMWGWLGALGFGGGGQREHESATSSRAA